MIDMEQLQNTNGMFIPSIWLGMNVLNYVPRSEEDYISLYIYGRWLGGLIYGWDIEEYPL